MRVGHLLGAELEVLASVPFAEMRRDVERHFDPTMRTLSIAAIFAPDGRVLAGDLEQLPAGLPPDGRPVRVPVTLAGRRVEILAASRRLASGDTLLVGREMRELVELRRIVVQALIASSLPALAISLGGGALLGRRAVIRVGDMHRTIERIVAGGLHERLPAGAGSGEFDQLAGSVNRMLDRTERLMAEARGVGDDIAHDLRTPLSHVRATLERLRDHEPDPERMRRGIDKSLLELERVFSLITALLRIAEMENGRREAGFGPVSLRAVAVEAVELYEPVAEAKAIRLALEDGPDATVLGDRALLIEALANLIDNAIKFTEPDGSVLVRAGIVGGQPAVSVSDDGIGLSADECRQVLKRFYRADRSRHVPGSGLGLSLVAAIASLHRATLAITSPGRGCLAEIGFATAIAPVPTPAREPAA